MCLHPTYHSSYATTSANVFQKTSLIDFKSLEQTITQNIISTLPVRSSKKHFDYVIAL